VEGFFISHIFIYMKLIITESKINNAIRKFIEDKYGDVNMAKSVHENGEAVGAYDFFLEDYDGDYIFTWTDSDYYKSIYPKYITKDEMERFSSVCPVVEVVDYPRLELDTLFGDRWKPVFKQWVEDKFNLPVKSMY